MGTYHKKRQGKLPLFYGNGERVIPIYALNLPLEGPLNLSDTKSQELKVIEAPPSLCALAPSPQWISEEYLWMIDACDNLRRQPNHKRNSACTMRQAVWRYLTAGSRRQVEVTTDDIGDFMDMPKGNPPDLQGA